MVAPCGPYRPWASWRRPRCRSLLPDFIVFRFTQAAVWAIALVGLVLLCGVSGQFSFAQAGLYGMGAYSAAILANHSSLSLYWALVVAPIVGYAGRLWARPLAGGHSPVDAGLDELCARHRLPAAVALATHRRLDRRCARPLPRPARSAGRLDEQRSLVFLPCVGRAGPWPVACRQRHCQPLRARPDGGAATTTSRLSRRA